MYSCPGYGSESAASTSHNRGFDPCLNGSGAQKTSPFWKEALLTILARVDRVILPLVVVERLLLVAGSDSPGVISRMIETPGVVADPPVPAPVINPSRLPESDEGWTDRAAGDICLVSNLALCEC